MTNFSNVTSSGIVQSGDTIVARMQQRRGYKINLPQPLAAGELGWCIDTKELFIGLEDSTSSSIINVSSQSAVQSLIDTKIMEFSSKWANLNVTANDAAGNPIIDTEEKLVNDLANMSANDILNDSFLVRDIVSKVGVLSHFRDAIDLAFTAYAPSSLITHKEIITVERTNIQPARILVTTNASGVVTTVSASFLDEDSGIGYYLGQEINIPNPNGTGMPAKVSVQVVSEDGEGRIIAVSVVSGGTGYPINMTGVKVTLPVTDYNDFRAYASTQLDGDQIDPASTVVDVGGMFYRTKPTVIVSGGSPTIPAIVEVDGWNPATGEIDTLLVVDVGAGYTSAPVITIAPPLTTEFYRFTYHIGANEHPTAYANVMTAINATDDIYYPASKLVHADFPAQVVGATGYGYTVVVDGNGDSTLTLTSPNQSSSLAAMINYLSPTNPPLALTSQNVEILTSYSAMPAPPTSVIYPGNKLYSGTLPPSATWTPVMAVDPVLLGPATALTFSHAVADVQHLSISVKDGSGGYLMAGTIMIASTSTDSDLTLSSTEVKSPALSTNDVYFRAITSGGHTAIEYKHDFPTNLFLKFTSAQWLS